MCRGNNNYIGTAFPLNYSKCHNYYDKPSPDRKLDLETYRADDREYNNDQRESGGSCDNDVEYYVAIALQ